jgi:hypothetical protein
VLPNPAGSEGAYVLPWGALSDFCAPSLHDRALWERVRTQPVLSPSAVREAARQVAAEGYAGRAAARAAGAAQAARQDGQARTEYAMLLRLLGQAEPCGTAAAAPPERDGPAGVQRRVRAVLRARAGQLPPAAALRALEQSAAAFAAIGVGAGAEAAPLRRTATALLEMNDGLEAWSAQRPPEERACADMVRGAAALTLRCVRRAFAEAQALLDDVWGLLRRWEAEAEEVRALVARPDWLLDGWSLIEGLWRAAGAAGPPQARSAALEEIALLVPVMPSEARDWLGFDAEGDMERHRSALRHWRRTVLARQDWVTGRMDEAAAAAPGQAAGCVRDAEEPVRRAEALRALCA